MGTRKKDMGQVVTPVAEPSQLELFDPDQVSSVTGIRVFDVGQGDCIGLLDQEGTVFCYIDYGGLADHPDATRPENTSRRLPTSYHDGQVSVILTHWDKDHYWSANKKNPKAQECEWLVPRQIASPQAAKFAARLPRAKCWPEDRGEKPARIGIGTFDIEIRKCAPFSKRKLNEDRNRTGLVVTLLKWNGETIDSVMVLPGDCPFHLIPQRPNAPVCALVAYHHGARSHWTKATKAAIATHLPDPEMVYSYGDNEYGHPYRKSYRPVWDALAKATAEARTSERASIDLYWKG